MLKYNRVVKMNFAKDVLPLLPEGYKQACWETKAMRRRKGIQDEDSLLKLCLYYAYDHSTDRRKKLCVYGENSRNKRCRFYEAI